jgi:single stranded DNA-binding protein
LAATRKYGAQTTEMLSYRSLSQQPLVSWLDKQTGERKDKTDWHNVIIWNEHAGKIAERYLKKGSKVYLEGQLQTREFTDKDGNQRKATEVVLSRFKGELTLLDSIKDWQAEATQSVQDQPHPQALNVSRDPDYIPF